MGRQGDFVFNGVSSTSGFYDDENNVQVKHSTDAAERQEDITAAKSLSHGQ